MASHAVAVPLLATAAENAHLPAVLLADAEADSSDAFARTLRDLGYRHVVASNAHDALTHLLDDSALQILVADVSLPPNGGFTLIEQARMRRGVHRPFAPILVASSVTAETALAGIRHDVVDLLPKACDADSCSAALARATRNLRTGNDQISTVSHQLDRIVSLLEGQPNEPLIDLGPGTHEIRSTLSTMIACRSLRARHLPGELFADPAWDILLDLMRAELAGEHVSVSSVCIAASVPMSTALRWVKQMTDAGLLKRWTDPRDRRRDLICLSDSASTSMKRYLATVHDMFRKVAGRS
jgi:CheY-like chemotaxis protein